MTPGLQPFLEPDNREFIPLWMLEPYEGLQYQLLIEQINGGEYFLRWEITTLPKFLASSWFSQLRLVGPVFDTYYDALLYARRTITRIGEYRYSFENRSLHR